MGPEATVDPFQKILAATPAQKDQDLLRIIIDCNSKMLSRPAALLTGGPDPTPLLQCTARNLEKAGADFLVVACNTAHAFYDRTVEAVRIPVLHIAEETVAELHRRYPAVQAAGILAGMGTIRLRLHHDRLKAKGITPISPTDPDQENVVAVSCSVKAGDKGPAVREKIKAEAEKLASRGAEVILTACTELPLVLQHGDVSVPVLDPTQILPEAAVRLARQ